MRRARAGSLLTLALAFTCPTLVAQGISPEGNHDALRKADAAYRAGQAAIAQNDLAAAQADFEQVVHLQPRMEQGHSALGAVLLSRGATKQAIHELEAALALAKNDGAIRSDSIAQTNLARAYQNAGQPAKAVALFTSLEADARAHNRPLAPATLAAFARALAAAGDASHAIVRMKTAVQADPHDADLHDELGSLYAQQHEWGPAEQEFSQALQLAPALAVAHLHLGLALQALGEGGGAELEQAAQLAPQNPLIAFELGRAYADAGQDTQALVQFQRALELQPGATEPMLQMALTLQRLDRSDEAFDLLSRVVAQDPDNADAQANLGLAYTQRQDAKDAVPILQHAVSLAPGNAVAHQDLAAAYIQLNQIDAALNELQTALRLSPDSSQIHYDLGLAFKMGDRPADAIPELERAEKLAPSAPEAPLALGQLYLQAGRYSDAARELKTSLDLQPNNADGWATLGSVYNNLNMLAEAVTALRQATQQDPGQPDAYLTLAAVLIKQNEPDAALQERKKAAELMRLNMNEQRAEVATHSGDGLLKSGDLAGATERYREALSYDARYPAAHLGLAKVLDAQGKALEAATERRLAAQTTTRTASP